jgi:Protein of unknown function (DUF3093)
MRDYRERLYVPVAYWLLAIPSILILGGTLYAGLPWPWPIISFAVITVICIAPLINFGRATVEVGDGMLRAGKFVLPLAAVSEVVVLDEKQSMRLRGPRADPAAVLYSRPYLKESVYLAVADGAQQSTGQTGVSGVPYWLVGTRHPAELAADIEQRRIRDGQKPVA